MKLTWVQIYVNFEPYGIVYQKSISFESQFCLYFQNSLRFLRAFLDYFQRENHHFKNVEFIYGHKIVSIVKLGDSDFNKVKN